MVFGTAWLWSALVEFGLGQPPRVHLSLYELFGLAASLGWVAGNSWVWVSRRESSPRRLFFLLFVGPPGALALLARGVLVGPGESGEYLGWLSSAVFAVLFLVPVTFTCPTRRGSKP